MEVGGGLTQFQRVPSPPSRARRGEPGPASGNDKPRWRQTVGVQNLGLTKGRRVDDLHVNTATDYGFRMRRAPAPLSKLRGNVRGQEGPTYSFHGHKGYSRLTHGDPGDTKIGCT